MLCQLHAFHPASEHVSHEKGLHAHSLPHFLGNGRWPEGRGKEGRGDSAGQGDHEPALKKDKCFLPASRLPSPSPEPHYPVCLSCARGRGENRKWEEQASGVWLCYTGGANMHLLALERGPPAGWCP